MTELTDREYRSIGPDSVNGRLYILIVLTTILSVGHHVDHVIRGNHVGWPLIADVTPFTYSLAMYPLIAIGLHLTLRERVGAGYWAVLLGVGLLLVVSVHFGPWASEPPSDIITPYEHAVVGYTAFAWLLGLVAALLIGTVYATHRWRWGRSAADSAVAN